MKRVTCIRKVKTNEAIRRSRKLNALYRRLLPLVLLLVLTGLLISKPPSWVVVTPSL